RAGVDEVDRRGREHVGGVAVVGVVAGERRGVGARTAHHVVILIDQRVVVVAVVAGGVLVGLEREPSVPVGGYVGLGDAADQLGATEGVEVEVLADQAGLVARAVQPVVHREGVVEHEALSVVGDTVVVVVLTG